MSGEFWLDLLLGVGGSLLAIWVAVAVMLLLIRPKGNLLREALRVLPDLLGLLRRLAGDATMPRTIRIQLGLLLAYLALPFDLIPDFVPVLGYADDAIVVAAVLRSVVRRAGYHAVRRHWPGSEDGFTALTRLTGLTPPQQRSTP